MCKSNAVAYGNSRQRGSLYLSIWVQLHQVKELQAPVRELRRMLNNFFQLCSLA
jgi:hypothetical protein